MKIVSELDTVATRVILDHQHKDDAGHQQQIDN